MSIVRFGRNKSSAQRTEFNLTIFSHGALVMNQNNDNTRQWKQYTEQCCAKLFVATKKAQPCSVPMARRPCKLRLSIISWNIFSLESNAYDAFPHFFCTECACNGFIAWLIFPLETELYAWLPRSHQLDSPNKIISEIFAKNVHCYSVFSVAICLNVIVSHTLVLITLFTVSQDIWEFRIYHVCVCTCNGCVGTWLRGWPLISSTN